MTGGQIDSLVVLVLACVVLAVLYVAVHAEPRLAVVVWILTVAFVPYWLGVTISVFSTTRSVYFPPTTALCAVLIAALLGCNQVRLRPADVVVALIVVVVVLSYVLGFASVASVSVAVMVWGAAYALGRMTGLAVRLPWIFAVVTVVMSVVAVLAVLESVTGFNPFVGLRASNALYTTWSPLQKRGGMTRAEGAFGHSIALGACIALTVPLAVASPLRKGVKVASIAALMAGAVVTFSRIGIGCSVLALVLCIIFLRSGLGTAMRVFLVGALGAAAIAVIPVVEGVFTQAGSEATASALYRGDLLSLVSSFNLVGTASSAQRAADGTLTFAGFQSIDSALIYAGLTYGLVVLLLICVLCVAAVVALLGKEPSAPLIAIVAQIPAIATVALITQYAAFFWFIAGLAVSAQALRGSAESAPANSRWKRGGTRTLLESGHVSIAVLSPSIAEGSTRRNHDIA